MRRSYLPSCFDQSQTRPSENVRAPIDGEVPNSGPPASWNYLSCGMVNCKGRGGGRSYALGSVSFDSRAGSMLSFLPFAGSTGPVGSLFLQQLPRPSSRACLQRAEASLLANRRWERRHGEEEGKRAYLVREGQ